MIELLIWRHAKSVHRKAGMNDRERALRPIGRDDAQEIGAILGERALIPDVILCSDAKRTRETVDAARPMLGSDLEQYDTGELYGAGARDYPGLISVYGGTARRILVVGHNPAVSDFVSAAAGRSVHMKTASLAVIEADAVSPAELTSSTDFSLRDVLVPPRRG